MLNKFKNKKEGFVILFTVALSSIILAIAIGVANIAFKEVRFGTSARNTNDAFFAADTGIECALFNDKLESTSFLQVGSSGVVNCLNRSIPVNGSFPTWDFIISNIGNDGNSCAKVVVYKDAVTMSPEVLTTITSKGYDIGDENCISSGTNKTERELKVAYVGSLATPPAPAGGDDGTGGTITHSNGYTIHTFTSSSSFNPGPNVDTVEYLIVAGGGGGGGQRNGFAAPGSGGAGGARFGTGMSVTEMDYPVVVGTGGAGGDAGGGVGVSGSGSSFNGIVTTGGGGGAAWNTNGGSGGSGGGSSNVGGSGISGEGYAGASSYGGAGGGAGAAASGVNPGDGIVWNGMEYAGGGGGSDNNYGRGRSGGKVYGNCPSIGCGTDGTGGGGGAGYTQDPPNEYAGGDGGDGIVIIRYPTP